MIIKKLHIDNFGKLHNFDFDFSEGLNVIKEDNSWGKTTFSNFIKAMFYGLEYNQKSHNERKQYEPWQGGVYGGSMEISIDGREYRIERTFGKKDKDDTFMLLNIETGKISEDFSSNIGEDIFKIDRESFGKSIYIPQCQTDTEMTDRLNAKIGNLTQAKDDISNYEIVKKKLEEKKKEYDSRSRKSKATLIKKEISDLEKKEKERAEFFEASKLIEKHINGKKKELSEIRKEKDKFNELLVKQSEKTEVVTLYNNALENLEKTEAKLKSIKEKYNGKIIDINELATLKNENENIKNLKGQIDFLEVTDDMLVQYENSKKMFENGIPDNSFWDEIKKKIDRAKALNISLINENNKFNNIEQYNELRTFFKEKYPSGEEVSQHIDNYHKAQNLRKEILENEINIKDSVKFKKINVNNLILYIIGLIMLVVGIVLATKSVNVFSIGSIVAGATMLALALYFGSIKSHKDSDTNSNQLQNQIDIKKQHLSELEADYMQFIQLFRVKYSESPVNVLIEIKEKQAEYDRLIQLAENYNKNATEYKNEMEECISYIKDKLSLYVPGRIEEIEKDSGYDRVLFYEKIFERLKSEINNYYLVTEKVEKYRVLLERLNEHSRIFNEIKENYAKNDTFNIDELEEDYKEYTRENNQRKELKIQAENLKNSINVGDDDEVYSVVELKEKIAIFDEQIEVLSEDISRHERDAERNYIAMEAMDGIEEEIEYKTKQLLEYKEKYELLNKTLSYMQLAKEKFSAGYLAPMKEAFSNYLKMINGVENVNISAEDLDIDIDLIPTLNYGSISKSKDSLSKGYQDLMGLCIRFALIDVMYRQENPVVILDDPFVNLDESKIENAMEIVKQMSQKYQIVYFTCHNSRT